MASELFGRYVWLMDTIRRYGRVTREEINRCWLRSSLSNGKPIPRRTFFNYKSAVQDIFNVNIECDPATFEYFIADHDSHNDSVTSWLLNSTAVSSVLTDARRIAGRIFIEDIPSAKHLEIAISALKADHAIRFTYHSYDRSKPAPNTVVEPYFLKIFRQRWYLTGRECKSRKIKTYALDRMTDVAELEQTFSIPADFDPEEFCRHSFGVIFNSSPVKTVRISADARTAKYLRALPLHHSQTEDLVCDSSSIFTYRLRLTDDFINELLSYGSRLTVIAPVELRKIITGKLREALKNYEKIDPSSALF